MNSLKKLSTGLIYRNPKPHLYSKQAYFPSVVSLGNGELFASLVIGQAFESVDCRIYTCRSVDNGKTWQLEGKLTELPHDKPISESCRITALSDSELVAWVFRCIREDTEQGLTNPENMGFVPTEMFLYRSKDKGRTWKKCEKVDPPLKGPCFELCCPITILSDGKWLAPTSTWPNWDGNRESGMKAVNLISYDKGKSWPEYIIAMDDHKKNIIYWEQKTIELKEKRLLCISWAYDEKQGKDLENHYSICNDGKYFTDPKPTGLKGQTPAILNLGKNKIFTIYRRTDKPGLWGNISTLKEDTWINETETNLWGKSNVNEFEITNKDMVEEFRVLKFGAPCCIKLLDETIFIAFWCVEDNASNIRWIKLKVKV